MSKQKKFIPFVSNENNLLLLRQNKLDRLSSRHFIPGVIYVGKYRRLLMSVASTGVPFSSSIQKY
jgi:hypothetical protein